MVVIHGMVKEKGKSARKNSKLIHTSFRRKLQINRIQKKNI